jgi:alpha-2-macroglobulin
MSGQERVDGGVAGPICPLRGSTPSRLLVAALAALLAACSPVTPSASPAVPTPAPSASQPTPSPTPPPATPAPPSPSPTPATSAWTPIALPAPPEIGAAMTAVAGSPYAADAAAGFRLRATGAVPLASLLRRLRVEPALAYRVVPEADGRGATLRPSAPLQPGASYRFTLVDQGGTPLTGWAFQVAGPPRVVSTIPADERTDVPISTGIEITFDQDGVAVEPGDIAVRLVPDGTAVAGAIEMHGRAAVFVPDGKLLAGRVYEVRVRAGTGATAQADGLARDVAFAFQAERTAPNAAVQAELAGAFVTSLPGERALLEARQWKNRPDGGWDEVSTPVHLRVYRLSGEAAAIRPLDRLLGIPAWAGAGARPIVSTAGLAVVFEGTAGLVRDGWDKRLQLPIATPAGWYLVELREAEISQAVLQVTDVVGMAGLREDRLVAWVNDAHAGRPVAGAPVDVVGGPRLGRTDARGVLVARTPASLVGAGGPILVRMTADAGRRVIVDLAGRDRNDSWTASWRPGLATWWTALSTDRWLYRPTDTIQAWGFLRARADDRPASTVRLRVWRDADEPRVGGPIATGDASQAPSGAWVGSIELRDVPYGYYRLEVVADGRVVETVGFEVGDVRKPPYQLEAAYSPRALVEGDALTATVTARFFDGTPTAGIPVAVRVDDGAPAREATTDTAGLATVSLNPRIYAHDTSQYACPSIVARPAGPVEAYVEDYQQICVFRGREYVDIEAVRDGESIVLSGAVHAVDLARVESWLGDPDRDWNAFEPRGAASGGRRVELLVTETVLRPAVSSRWYDPITKRVVEQYDWEEGASTTASHVVATGADGTYRLRVPAKSASRSWSVDAVVVDDAGHRIVASTSIWEPRAANEASWYSVDLRGDEDGPAVGDAVTAVLTQRNGDREVPVPAGGANRFLFLVTGPTRFDAIVSPTAEATVRFEAADEPNLEFQVVWFTGRGYALPGGTTAYLRTEDRTLGVVLAADKARYEPGARASVTVETVDAAGRPVSASVLLRGVDEKLVAMGVADFADPIELLYRRLTVGLLRGPVVSHEVRLPGSDGGKGSTTGGGGGDAERSDVRDFLPMRLVTTGADGRAVVSFDLPDDVTSWHIAATAMTADRRAGSASVLLPVGLPFFADATIAPEYLAGDRVAIRLRAFGSALAAGAPVRFTVSSTTLGMAPVTVGGAAFAEVLVPLPALTAGTHQVTIAATSGAGADRLVRTFRVVESRLAAGRRETVAITGPTQPPGGPDLTRLVLADAGRARYLALLEELAAPRGQRADEQLAATVARRLLVEHLGVSAADLPDAAPFARSTYQAAAGGLALLPYGSADLELTVRALVTDPGALLADSARSWLRAIADDPETGERRTVALVGLAALGEPVLGSLGAALDDPAAGGRTRLWAALGLAILGDRDRAVALERSLLARWGERRGDQVRLRISDDAEEVSEATELLALLAARVDHPLAADALAYVTEVPPLDDLAVLTQVSVAGRLVARLPAEPAVVALVEDGVRSTVEIPAGGSVALHVPADRRARMRLEPVSGAVAVTASWDEPAPSTSALGRPDPDLALTRAVLPASPIAPNSLVRVQLDLRVEGPGRNGTVEVTDLLPSGLAALGGPGGEGRDCGRYAVAPARIEGQRVTFVVTFRADPEDEAEPRVPGTFCLDYAARVVTAGTYGWQSAVARQATSPGLVAVTPADTVELR